MKVTKLQGKNIRSFKGEVSIELSNINVFVGENGSGKSNLINLIQLALQSGNGVGQNVPPFDGRFSNDSSFGCEIEFNTEELNEVKGTEVFNRLIAEASSNSPPGVAEYMPGLKSFSSSKELIFESSWSRQGGMAIRQRFPAIPNLETQHKTGPVAYNVQSQMNFLNGFYNLIREQIIRKTMFITDTRELSVQFPTTISNPQNPVDVNSIMTYVSEWMLNDRDIYNKLLEFLGRLLHYLSALHVQLSGNTGILSIEEQSLANRIQGNDLSKGFREILVVLSALVLARYSSLFIIEEPEVHLHPLAIKELKSLILEVAKEKKLQIIVSTHNPILLSDLHPDDDTDVKVFEFSRGENGGNAVKEIRTDKEISTLIDKMSFR